MGAPLLQHALAEQPIVAQTQQSSYWATPPTHMLHVHDVLVKKADGCAISIISAYQRQP
jgi:hypothetical protein